METLASAKISRQDVIGSKKSQQKSFKKLVFPVETSYRGSQERIKGKLKTSSIL